MPTVTKRDYYEVLGVGQDAEPDEIKAAYRRLALRHHPDKNQGDAMAADRFKEAAEAYEVLSDPERRARYDRFGHAGVNGEVGFRDVGDVFSAFGDILGSIFGTEVRTRGGPQRGASLQLELQVSFDEMAEGTRKVVSLRRQEACEQCRGSGSEGGRPPATCGRCRGSGFVATHQGFFAIRRPCALCRGEGVVVQDPCRPCGGEGQVAQRREVEVRVPAGVEDGTVLRFTGEGEAGRRAGPRGDLHVIVRVQEHDLFVRSPRDPADLFVEVPVPVSTALVGGEVEVPTLEGADPLRVEAGTEPGAVLRMRAKGLPRLQRSGRGDLYVRVAYDVPKKPGRKLRKALEALAQAEQAEGGPASGAFRDRLEAHRRQRAARGQPRAREGSGR